MVTCKVDWFRIAAIAVTNDDNDVRMLVTAPLSLSAARAASLVMLAILSTLDKMLVTTEESVLAFTKEDMLDIRGARS